MHSIRCRLVCLYVCHKLGLYKMAERIKKLFSGQMQGGQETMYYMRARIPPKKVTPSGDMLQLAHGQHTENYVWDRLKKPQSQKPARSVYSFRQNTDI